MIETNQVVQEMIHTLYEACSGFDRGDVIPHELVEEITGESRHKGTYDHVINSVRRRIEDERGIATWFVRTVGYQLLTVEEQLSRLPFMRGLKQLSQSRKIARSLRALPKNELTLHQQQILAFQLRSQHELRRQIREQMAQADIFANQREPERKARQKPAPLAIHHDAVQL